MDYTQAHVCKGDIRTMGYAAHVERYASRCPSGCETFAVGGGPLDLQIISRLRTAGSDPWVGWTTNLFLTLILP
jgi:hypothetical protein